MVVKRIEPRRRFTAFDEDGNEYTIIELVKILDSSTLQLQGQREVSVGCKRKDVVLG